VKHRFTAILIFLFSLFSFLIFSGCQRSSVAAAAPAVLPDSAAADAAAGSEETEPVITGPDWPVLAILKPGANPIWFEYSGPEFGKPGEPRQIASPAEASLVDFTPWPLSYYSAGLLPFYSQASFKEPAKFGQSRLDSFLALTVNRCGFIIFGNDPVNGPGCSVVYKADDPGGWDPYSAACVFLYDQKPAVLLYRDNFFSVPGAGPPEYPVRLLEETSSVPTGINLPVFDDFSGEMTALNYGPDQNWYYRVTQSDKSLPETAYYRTAGLAQPGQKISQGEYRGGSAPANAGDDAPVIKTLALFAAENISKLPDYSQKTPVLRMISPFFLCARDFAPEHTTGAEFIYLTGYFINNPIGSDPADPTEENDGSGLALAVLPDGRGFACREKSVFTFSLPSLPQGFAYTGAGLIGNTLIATWEEQQEYSIGAAGFMALDAQTLGL